MTIEWEFYVKEGINIKIVKLYLDEEFIKSKLGEEYQNCNVIFKDAVVGVDNTITFECIVTEEDISNSDLRRYKIV